MLPAEGKITEDVVANMRSWKHSGFSVDQSVRLEAGDPEGVQRLIPYFLRGPFSQARIIRLRPGRATAGQVEVTEAGKVIYKTEPNAVGRFPEPGEEERLAGPARNFQVFDPLDFLAEVTQHIPDPIRALPIPGRPRCGLRLPAGLKPKSVADVSGRNSSRFDLEQPPQFGDAPTTRKSRFR